MKILIVEDDNEVFGDFKEILETLDEVYVFPRDKSENNDLISDIDDKKYDEILNQYKDIDLFILDVYLSTAREKEKTGIMFCKHIQEKIRAQTYPNRAKFIIVSSGYLENHEIPSKDTSFINKNDESIHLYEVLKEKVRDLLETTKKAETKELSPAPPPTQVEPSPAQETDPERIKFERNKLEFEISYKLHKKLKKTQGLVSYYIDKIIFLALYILLVITTFYALINTGYTVIKGIEPVNYLAKKLLAQVPQSPNSEQLAKQNEMKEPDYNPDTSLLETTEHIFLYLIPLFTVLGFFHYYKNNARYSLLEGSAATVNYEVSTRTMNLSKILFISSIIAYVTIKIIDEIFIKGVTDQVKLISFGTLLLILMGYYIFLNKHQK